MSSPITIRLAFASCLLAAGCASTSSTVPGGPARTEVEVERAPVAEAEPSADVIEDVAYSVPLSAAEPKLLPVVQGSGGGAAQKKSPHSFSGGVGVRFRDGQSALNLLAQYQYHVNPKVDIGGIVDWAFSPIDSILIAPAAWWHPTKKLTVFGAPGVEFLSGNGGKAALRVGGSYAIVIGKVVIRPFGWYDFVQDRADSFAFGVGFGL